MTPSPGPGAQAQSGARPEFVPYPRFSDREMDRRRGLVLQAMEERGVDHLVAYGADRSGTAVGWLTGWPVTREAAVVVAADEPDELLVQFHNHVPNARTIARRARVSWGGHSTIAAVAALVESRGGRRAGVVGRLTSSQAAVLQRAGVEIVAMDGDYTAMRLVKSREEIEWLRVGARMSDRAVGALKHARPGHTELDLVDMIERAYVSLGAVTHIHYLASTSMHDPDACVPRQHPSGRVLAEGDALVCEISASFWEYPGQVLRTFALAAEPPTLYRDLHAAADAAFDAITAVLKDGAHATDVVEAASVIEDSGFTVYDDLLHGFVGGYLPPVLGTRSRMLEETPDFVFRTGMTVVVQPNVITTDERAGVQTGELVLVTDDGFERLHGAERGMRVVGVQAG